MFEVGAALSGPSLFGVHQALCGINGDHISLYRIAPQNPRLGGDILSPVAKWAESQQHERVLRIGVMLRFQQ